MRLKKLHDTYKKWLHIEDTDRIDIILAVALSSQKRGIPLWLFMVGPSGDGKSEQVNPLKDLSNAFELYNLTSSTLVNGWNGKEKKKFPDLAPELDNKLVIISDMAQILKLPVQEKAQVWGQLRDLYDGFAGKVSGMGARVKYKDIFVTLIACSTPVIDAQILINQDLGTRELIYRTSGNENKDELMNKCLEDEEYYKKMKKAIQKITIEFLEEYSPKEIKVSKKIIKELKEIALYVSKMRTTAEFDSYSHELRNFVYPEEPTRIIKQLRRLYVSLMDLDEVYDEEKAMRIIRHVAKSSASPLRVRIYEFLKENLSEYSTSKLYTMLRIGKGTIQRECLVLEAVGLIKCRMEESDLGKYTRHWIIKRTD